NPLLITYNGNNYLDIGWKNLMKMKDVFNVDHHIISPSVSLLKRLNRLGFTMMGDMNWHNHAGIATLPMQMAAKFKIPLVFYGEHGWTDLGGMHSMRDLVEYTARFRKDQQMRGFDWHDMTGHNDENIKENEMEIFKYPSDEEINEVGLRGLFIGNYDPWDANTHTALITAKYGWEENPEEFERTYRRFSNLDDRYENGSHDYLKFVKFGYGRGTDHACKDIRSGHMTRNEGIEMVKKYDHVRPSDLKYWLNYVEKDEAWFDRIADSFRSPKVWAKTSKNEWVKRNIWD
ncbi:N-acetyl sugar amidotransferase, partial [Candidatus Puniceispirillum sp.]|nr:N-acetyl sugar amidotransferase [Candidatus Puniceispirillum sp.]